MSLDGLSFRRFDAAQARKVAGDVREIYAHSYVEQIATGDPFRTPDAFMERFDAYTSRPGSKFEMVQAVLDGNPVAQAWGWPLESNTAWWGGLELDDAQQDIESFTFEDGNRTFAFSELMVRTESTGRGIARALHSELTGNRPEQRATLLVAPTNRRAYDTYLRWGWRRVGTLTPNWDGAPKFDVLILDLH